MAFQAPNGPFISATYTLSIYDIFDSPTNRVQNASLAQVST